MTSDFHFWLEMLCGKVGATEFRYWFSDSVAVDENDDPCFFRRESDHLYVQILPDYEESKMRTLRPWEQKAARGAFFLKIEPHKVIEIKDPEVCPGIDNFIQAFPGRSKAEKDVIASLVTDTDYKQSLDKVQELGSLPGIMRAHGLEAAHFVRKDGENCYLTFFTESPYKVTTLDRFMVKDKTEAVLRYLKKMVK